MVRLILAVVVGFTSVAALPVCENSASGSGCPINKGQCCNVIPRPFALGCAAKCCEVLVNEAAPGECPNFFNAISEVGCECAVDETDVPTAEPTPSPAPPICRDTLDSCNIGFINQVCRPVRGPIIQALRCAASSCTFLAREAAFGPECPNFYNPADPNVPQLYIQTGPAAGSNCLCAAEETDAPTAEPTPAPTPCRPCKTAEDCDEFEICNVPSAPPPRRGLRFGHIPEGCCRGAR